MSSLMLESAEARIPLTLFTTPSAVKDWLAAGAPAAVLAEAPMLPPDATATARFEARVSHRFGCRCCTGRSAAALALDRLFQARARGQVAWFERLAVLCASTLGREQVRTALMEDVLTLARYRPGGDFTGERP